MKAQVNADFGSKIAEQTHELVITVLQQNRDHRGFFASTKEQLADLEQAVQTALA